MKTLGTLVCSVAASFALGLYGSCLWNWFVVPVTGFREVTVMAGFGVISIVLIGPTYAVLMLDKRFTEIPLWVKSLLVVCVFLISTAMLTAWRWVAVKTGW